MAREVRPKHREQGASILKDKERLTKKTLLFPESGGVDQQGISEVKLLSPIGNVSLKG